MTFIQYLKGKRFFIGFYLLLMGFISLILFVSDNWELAVQNLLYTHLFGFILVSLYLGIGYYYHSAFYRQLKTIIEHQQDDLHAILPEAQTPEQQLYLALFKRNEQIHSKKIQELIHEKQDHQDFILSWVHEAKLPIATSLLLLENSSSDNFDFLVDKLEDELVKMENYVEQALYYSRIDSFSKDYFITDLSLNKLIKKSLKQHAKLFITKRMTFNLEDNDTFVQSDAKWLLYIINQIVTNALKYSTDDGNLSFIIDENAIEKRLRIIDRGIGIKEEDLPRVFDKGFTGSNGRIYHNSTGMGLHLAKQLALKLGHNLSIESKEGEYTIVTIHFPKINTYYDFKA